MKVTPVTVREEPATAEATPTAWAQRCIGPVIGPPPGQGAVRGPTTILLGAVHGNEPAGVRAIEHVLTDLAARRVEVRGRIVGLLGNRRAFAAGQRYLDSDLNRAFIPPEDLEFSEEARRRSSAVGASEALERAEILESIREILADRDRSEEVIVLDLHTFSAPGPPFSVCSDTIRNRDLASALPLPLILGLIEELHGTLADYLTACGCRVVVIEGGQHEDPRAEERHVAALRLALVHAGHVTRAQFPALAQEATRLRATGVTLPHTLDVKLRHAITPEDRFRMRPGFSNFDPVRAHQALADDVRGAVGCQRAGHILLPLYQAKGDDGYFLAAPVDALWLLASKVLRKTRLGELVRLLPGVSAHPSRPDTLVVDTRIARLLAVNLFHLLGFRRLRREDELLVVTRRPYDLEPPDDVRI